MTEIIHASTQVIKEKTKSSGKKIASSIELFPYFAYGFGTGSLKSASYPFRVPNAVMNGARIFGALTDGDGNFNGGKNFDESELLKSCQKTAYIEAKEGFRKSMAYFAGRIFGWFSGIPLLYICYDKLVIPNCNLNTQKKAFLITNIASLIYEISKPGLRKIREDVEEVIYERRRVKPQ